MTNSGVCWGGRWGKGDRLAFQYQEGVAENPGQGPLLDLTQATHFHFQDALHLLAEEKLIRFNKRQGC